MSLLVGTFGKPLTFEQWLLTEAIEPVLVEYGSNAPLFNNKEISLLPSDIKSTCFLVRNLLYMVQLDSHGEIAFGVSEIIPETNEELYTLNFSDKIVKSIQSNGLNIFNKVFYVLLELLKNTKDSIFFQSANVDLEHFYTKLLGNKFFNKRLNDIGYSDMFLDEGKFKINYLR
jgi:hypothetical protein